MSKVDHHDFCSNYDDNLGLSVYPGSTHWCDERRRGRSTYFENNLVNGVNPCINWSLLPVLSGHSSDIDLFFPQESDLTFRLASGLVIWQPMWEHRQPEVSGFTALVKPIRNIITGAWLRHPVGRSSQAPLCAGMRVMGAFALKKPRGRTFL